MRALRSDAGQTATEYMGMLRGRLPRYGAGWDPKAKQLVLSKGLGVPLDVVAHEFAHGVVLSELAGFSHKGENGALGEAIADMFASNLDPDDWQIGEDLSVCPR